MNPMLISMGMQGAQGISTMFSNSKIAKAQRAAYERQRTRIYETEAEILDTMSENYLMKLQDMSLAYVGNISALNQSTMSVKSDLDVSVAQSNIDLGGSSYYADSKEEIDRQFTQGLQTLNGMQDENTRRLSMMNENQRINVLRDSTQQVINAREGLMNSINSLTTQNKMAGMNFMGSVAAYGLDVYSQKSKLPGTIPEEAQLSLGYEENPWGSYDPYEQRKQAYQW